jgi:hypothetical protein
MRIKSRSWLPPGGNLKIDNLDLGLSSPRMTLFTNAPV